MIVETTHYYARRGNADAVLKQRRHATAIRVRLGLAPGRILRKIGDAGPDVRWECEFANQEQFDHDMAARAACAEFAAARQAMHRYLDRFERHIQQRVDD